MFTATLALLLLYAQAAVGQSLFQLNIQIATNQLPLLKNSGYNLCIAKKVNGNYTVVWSGNQAYLQNNLFEWTESYQVFGANSFKDGALVSVATNTEDIQFGQTSVLTNTGVLNPATGPISPGPFFLTNEYGPIGIGVNALFDDEYLPIYVSPGIVAIFNSLQPINTVKVWFAINQATSTMFFRSETTGFEVVYNGVTSQTISYSGPTGNAVWSSGPLSQSLSSSISPNSTTSSAPSTNSLPPSTTSSVRSTTLSAPSTTFSAPSTTQTPYGQCGGLGWTGATSCSVGFTCTISNPFFSQCI